jgi:S-adenosylmethionine-diacylglycerol 3-amino-3-carboxypropyl transferase
MTRLRSEVAQDLALDRIRYSAVWEDHRLLREGLQIQPDDDVLSITSAGDNALSLLLLEPASVTAIDMNPAQNALLELKVLAISELDHSEFAALIGVRGGHDRLALYRGFRSALSTSSRAFWDSHEGDIKAGIIHRGRLENYISGFAQEHLPALWADDLLPRLMEAPTLSAQAALFSSEGLTAAFSERFRWYFGREMMAKNGRDPAQFAHVTGGDVGGYFLERFTWAMTHTRLADNFYVELFLSGHLSDLERGPCYLRPSNYERLGRLTPRLRIVTGEFEQLAVGSFSKANLSDIFEYMSPDLNAAVFGLIADRLRPGGRIAWWNLLVPRTVPQELQSPLNLLTELSEALWLKDRSWFYRAFHVAQKVTL